MTTHTNTLIDVDRFVEARVVRDATKRTAQYRRELRAVKCYLRGLYFEKMAAMTWASLKP